MIRNIEKAILALGFASLPLARFLEPGTLQRVRP
jgi:hypothetical protein